MKNSVAAKKPRSWFGFLTIVVPGLWALSFWLRDWPMGVIAGLMSVYLVVDAWKLIASRSNRPSATSDPAPDHSQTE